MSIFSQPIVSLVWIINCGVTNHCPAVAQSKQHCIHSWRRGQGSRPSRKYGFRWSVSRLIWTTERWNDVQVLSFKAWCEGFNDWEMGYVVSYACGICVTPFLRGIYVLKNKLTIIAFLCPVTWCSKRDLRASSIAVAWEALEMQNFELHATSMESTSACLHGVRGVAHTLHLSCPALWSRCY